MDNQAIWRDCVKEPSEIGKKVLCQKDGDFYVAIRVEDYYIPIPFADHYFGKKLSKPQTWCEISFPKPYTGHLRVKDRMTEEIMTLSDAKFRAPKAYMQFCRMIIKSIGALSRPKKRIMDK